MTRSRYETTRVGLNPLGDMVLFCELCRETFAKKVQNSTVDQITSMVLQHVCRQRDVELVELANKKKLEELLKTSPTK